MVKAQTLWRLGLWNVFAVVSYRLRLRLGVHPVQRVRRTIAGATFFGPSALAPPDLKPPVSWRTHALYFGWFRDSLGDNPPDWHRNPFTGQRITQPEKPWWKLSDYGSGVGDIKTVWEASRFDWVVAFAQQARCGDPCAVARLNCWVADWTRQNPPYLGPNWKCGQEASVRVLHLLLAARFLGQLESPEGELVQLVEAHLARIYPTLAYAMAQDNNHGTSEAAALFLGGDWCARHGIQIGNVWHKAGRRWLENRAARLIETDGGFSQHSVNYHRLMLDTLCLAELWRQWFSLPHFSDRFYQRAQAATRWLQVMTNPETGDAPNLGANDGANLLPLTDADYRDYRPAVQLASVLFKPQCAYCFAGFHYDHIRWLGLARESVDVSNASAASVEGSSRTSPASADSQTPVRDFFNSKGYMILQNGPWKAIFRYPHYRFRPGQCDALHVDLWFGSDNLLRDAGSYSYNAEPGMAEYFTGPEGHNTVQFDDRDPMPRIGPFLRGAWLQADLVAEPEERDHELSAGASYRDWCGASHQRRIRLGPEGLRVQDDVNGFRHCAMLRWRLAPGEWTFEGNTVVSRRTAGFAAAGKMTHRISIDSQVPVHAVRLVAGWESRYYLNKQQGPVLEVEIREPGTVVCEFRLEP